MATKMGKLHRLESNFGRTLEKQGTTFKPSATTPQFGAIAEEQLNQQQLEKSEEIWLDVELIDDNPFQPRLKMDPKDQAQLVEDLNQDGQLQAGAVRPHPTRKGRYQMIWGHRRKYAVKDGYLFFGPDGGPPKRIYANAGTGRSNANQYIGKIRVELRQNVDDLVMQRMAIKENTSRVDLDTLELAKSYRDTMNNLTQWGRNNGTIGKDGKGNWKSATYRDVATFLKKSRSQVNRLIRLLELPEPMQKALEDGKLGERHGRALLQLAPWPEHQLTFFNDIKRSGVGGEGAEREAKRRKDILNAKTPNEKSREQERLEAQLEREDATFDPDAEQRAQERRAEIASVMTSDVDQAALALGAGNVESSVNTVPIEVANQIEEQARLDGLMGGNGGGYVGGHGGGHGGGYKGLTRQAILDGPSQAAQVPQTPEELAEHAAQVATITALEKGTEIGFETVAAEFEPQNLVAPTPGPVVESGTNGVAQIPRLPDVTKNNMVAAVKNLEWADMGFNIMAVAPQDVSYMEGLIHQAAKHIKALEENLRRHKQQNQNGHSNIS